MAVAKSGVDEDVHLGKPVYHARAESWECDIHRHWNTRFFCCSFQTAAESCSVLTGGSVADADVDARYIQFHREVLESDAIGVHAFAPPEPATGAIYCMVRNGQLIAAAHDTVPHAPKNVPALPATLSGILRPRGLQGEGSRPWVPDAATDFLTELGVVSRNDLQGKDEGALPFGDCLKRMTYASIHHIGRIGLTADYTRTRNVGRMVAEMRYQRLGTVKVGDAIRGASRLTAVRDKSYVVTHLLYDQHGKPLAVFDLCNLTVDLGTRRVVAIPDFVRDAGQVTA